VCPDPRRDWDHI
jgi:hypothetical protein